MWFGEVDTCVSRTFESIRANRGNILEPEVERVDERFQRFDQEQFAKTARLARMLTGNPDVDDDLAQVPAVKPAIRAPSSSANRRARRRPWLRAT